MAKDIEEQLDKIFERMDDYTVFHDRNDGDFESPGETYLSSSEAKAQIQTLITNLVAEAELNARIAESGRWHRYGGRDYDNKLDEAIDNRTDELENMLEALKQKGPNAK